MSPAAYLLGHMLGTHRAEHKTTGPVAQAQEAHQVQECQLVANAGWRVTVDQLPQGQHARDPPLAPGCPHSSYQCFHRHLKLDPNSGPRTPRKDTFCPPNPALLLWPMAGSQSPSVTTSSFKLNNPNNLSSLLITSKLCRMLYICKSLNKV